MTRLRRGCLSLLFACFTVSHVLAQGECADIVAQALETTDENCANLGRDQACYGNAQVEAEAQSWATSFIFGALGDRVDVAAVQTLTLSSLVEDEGLWGVSLMSIQANLPDSQPGQNVTFVVFGQVAVTNAVEVDAVPVEIEVTATSNPNIRSFPSTDSVILGSLTTGETLIADGRLEDGTWIRVRREQGGVGWIFAQLLTSEGDLTTLPIVEPSAPVFGPMQAFYFQSGVGDAPCAEAPASGILIQTPEGVGEISLLINEVDIRLGSTAYLQAQPDDQMSVYIVEGRAEIESQGETVTAPAGTVVQIPVDNDLAASGAPTDPQPYDSAVVANLPTSLLPETIEVAEPLSEEEIQAEINTASGVPLSGSWRMDVTSATCETSGSNMGTLTVSADGSTITSSNGIVFTRSSPGVYTNNSEYGQQTLQVVSSDFMTFSATVAGCSLQANMVYLGD
jgi:hypothetical protein